MTAPFRLRRLLNLREQHEQAMARNLATAQGAVEAERRVAHDLRKAREISRERAAQVATKGTTMGELVSLNLALLELDQHSDVADERTRAAEARVDECHQALAIAARARLMLDRLKSRHDETVRLEEKAHDTKTMDSIALTRHVADNRSNAAMKRKQR